MQTQHMFWWMWPKVFAWWKHNAPGLNLHNAPGLNLHPMSKNSKGKCNHGGDEKMELGVTEFHIILSIITHHLPLYWWVYREVVVTYRPVLPGNIWLFVIISSYLLCVITICFSIMEDCFPLFLLFLFYFSHRINSSSFGANITHFLMSPTA